MKTSTYIFIGKIVLLLPELEVTGLFEICMFIFRNLYFPVNNIITGYYRVLQEMQKNNKLAYYKLASSNTV